MQQLLNAQVLHARFYKKALFFLDIDRSLCVGLDSGWISSLYVLNVNQSSAWIPEREVVINQQITQLPPPPP